MYIKVGNLLIKDGMCGGIFTVTLERWATVGNGYIFVNFRMAFYLVYCILIVVSRFDSRNL